LMSQNVGDMILTKVLSIIQMSHIEQIINLMNYPCSLPVKDLTSSKLNQIAIDVMF